MIDLTEEPDSSPQHTRPRQGTPSGTTPRASRPPRFERDILSEPDVDVVDLVNEPDSPVAAGDPNRRPPTSPDVEFVRATSRPPRPRPRPQPRGRSSFFSMMRRSAQLWPHQFLPLDMETIWIGEGGGPGIDLELDLDMRGLATPAPGPPAPASSYKPPSPAPEGFTRSAGEDELVVCPNCEVELGTGDEQKQQVWVAKSCGHVCVSLPLRCLRLLTCEGVLRRMRQKPVSLEVQEIRAENEAFLQMPGSRLREVGQLAEIHDPNLSLGRGSCVLWGVIKHGMALGWVGLILLAILDTHMVFSAGVSIFGYLCTVYG